MAESDIQGIARRLREVREATGLTQIEFLPRLNAAAKSLNMKRTYAQALLSRFETGTQVPTFADVAAYAVVDPKRRGKTWLAWGERADAITRETEEAVSRRLGAAPMEMRPVDELDEEETQPAAPSRRRRG